MTRISDFNAPQFPDDRSIDPKKPTAERFKAPFPNFSSKILGAPPTEIIEIIIEITATLFSFYQLFQNNKQPTKEELESAHSTLEALVTKCEGKLSANQMHALETAKNRMKIALEEKNPIHLEAIIGICAGNLLALKDSIKSPINEQKLLLIIENHVSFFLFDSIKRHPKIELFRTALNWISNHIRDIINSRKLYPHNELLKETISILEKIQNHQGEDEANFNFFEKTLHEVIEKI